MAHGPLHERVHQRGQNRTGTENKQHTQNQEHHDQRNEPPFFLLFEKKHELFRELKHGRTIIAILWCDANQCGQTLPAQACFKASRRPAP